MLNSMATTGGACMAGDWVALRVVDGDGGGGLTAGEMVKYTVPDDGENGQI